MGKLGSLALPDLVLRRLQVLAKARNTKPSELAAQILADFTKSPEARRDIRKYRKGKPLTDLGWIAGYEGESVDNILALSDSENAYQVLFVLEQSIEQHGKKQPGSRTGVENIIMAVMALMREVNNGGFDQFYRNASKRWAFFVRSALVHIGRTDAAKIAGRAQSALGKFAGAVLFPGIGDRFKELDEKMSQHNARRHRTFEECDTAFQQLTGLPESLLAYARQHPNGILKKT
jgi:Domain of unknown function (DUF4375)